MWKRLFKKKKEPKTAIGVDSDGARFHAVRLSFSQGTPHLTHSVTAGNLLELKQKLEPADILITRPPSGGYFARRVIQVPGDWTDESHLSLPKRGYAVYQNLQTFSTLPVDETVYGWKVLGYDSSAQTSEVEVHQASGVECAQMLGPFHQMSLGPVQLDSVHCTALSCVIPPRYPWHILETRNPSGFCLMKNGRMVTHLEGQILLNRPVQHIQTEILNSYLESYRESGQAGPIQVYFLQPGAIPNLVGMSCSWIGENCAELLDTRIAPEYLQPLGLAMSRERSWWLHHITEFYKKGPKG